MKRFPSARHALLTFALSLAALGLAAPASGQTTWTGAVSGDWTNAGNWSNGVPTAAGQATFNGAGTGATLINVNSTNFAGSTFTSGAYTTTLNSFSSTVVINGGSLTLSNNVSFTNGSPTITVATGAALNFTSIGGKSSGATFAGGGNYNIGNITTTGSSGTYTKTGAGTLTLNGSSYTYNAGTSVTAGTLLVTGNLTSVSLPYTVTVTGATIGGTGTIARSTTVNTGATLAPGVTVGTLTFGNALTLNTGSTTAFQLNGTTRGTTYDALNITAGATDLGGTLALDFGSTFSAGDTLDLFNFSGTSSLTSGRSFDAITGTGLYAGSFTDNSGVWTLETGGLAFTFTETTGDLTVAAASAIPEPASLGVLAAVGVLVVAVRRRRGQRAAA